MGHYKNFTVDFPQRLSELDKKFRPIASSADLDVTYVLMKLAASFLLPYERLEGTSGARTADLDGRHRQDIRRKLELDKLFFHSSYCDDPKSWFMLDVENFMHGPEGWQGKERRLKLPVHKVLNTIRNSVAHSNLHFAGEHKIQHVYLGSRRERSPETGKYLVIGCTVVGLDHLVDAWIHNVQGLRVSPALIWRELEAAA
jgi:hypothetical protein